MCYTNAMTTTSENTDIKTVLFFAYGTLRKTERLHDWIRYEVIEDLGVAEMPMARLFYARNHRSYPYLAMTENPSDKAMGEIYKLPLNDQVLSMLQMEVNAGYSIVETEATVNGEPVTVMVCALDPALSHLIGEAIPNNDWCCTERTQWWRNAQ